MSYNIHGQRNDLQEPANEALKTNRSPSERLGFFALFEIPLFDLVDSLFQTIPCFGDALQGAHVHDSFE